MRAGLFSPPVRVALPSSRQIFWAIEVRGGVGLHPQVRKLARTCGGLRAQGSPRISSSLLAGPEYW
jgi:hypothetical protein